MKKPLTGVLIFLFCLFGIVGISQEKSLKAPEPLFAILGIGAAAGFFMAILNHRKSRKARSALASLKDGERKAEKASPPNDFIVRLPKSREYAVPKPCCSCYGAANSIWPATGWQGLRRYSIDFPFCKTCSKQKYPWWSHREPVSIYHDLRADQMHFLFHNEPYAWEFSRINGGKGLG